ncbi:Lrp/AsnC family transcriptional regulator [Pseudonocardia xinjiangensis]|uniref:Lrp/AsnC family transcriptional regulator n=2 Tax=Pseudonocardia xinjiangensis TaxID=75289 RepID=A0ABX1RQ89_9PSEU|nr:Lrp/AsnC family transcriptional regulator [Pseudonocardia xinjiangensis]
MESVTFDHLDRSLVHALMVDGRAPFARFGEVLGVSDRTVARRYARLRGAGIVRPVGAIDAAAVGSARWVIRVRCQPGSAGEVALALARREDTQWVHLVSGGTEITASLHSWSPEERDELILHRLQRTEPVVSVTAHSVLNVFGNDVGGFRGLHVLDDAQVAALSTGLPRGGRPAILTDTDRPLLRALSHDGRTGYPALAAATGWSESTVARRIEALRAAGVLYFDVDVDEKVMGFHTEARLWASVPPSHLADTGAAIAAHPEVAFCAATTGATNLLAAVVCRDGPDFYRYLTERIGALPLVREVETAPLMRTVKRSGALQ